MREHMEHARLWLSAIILAPAWEWIRAHWAGFWWSSPLIWICLFWVADWLLGSARAAWDGWSHPDEPERGFRPRRALLSLGKLAGYVAGLMVAWGLRDSAGLGGAAVAAVAEAGILLYEASSVFRHLAALTGLPIFRWISTTADRASRRGQN